MSVSEFLEFSIIINIASFSNLNIMVNIGIGTDRGLDLGGEITNDAWAWCCCLLLTQGTSQMRRTNLVVCNVTYNDNKGLVLIYLRKNRKKWRTPLGRINPSSSKATSSAVLSLHFQNTSCQSISYLTWLSPVLLLHLTKASTTGAAKPSQEGWGWFQVWRTEQQRISLTFAIDQVRHCGRASRASGKQRGPKGGYGWATYPVQWSMFILWCFCPPFFKKMF